MGDEQREFFRQRYRGMEAEELIELRQRETLVEVAYEVLDEILAEKGISEEVKETLIKECNQQKRVLGTKWLSFCAYYQYPVGGIAGIWAALSVPIPAFPRAITVALFSAIFLFVIAYGLHRRRMWAWQVNWVVMALGAIFFLTEQSSNHGLVILVKLFGIGVWAWLNFIYWTKRRGLFS